MGVEIGKKLPFSFRPPRRSPEWTARVSKRLGCSITTYTNPIQPEPCRRRESARASVDLGPRAPDEKVVGCADPSSRGWCRAVLSIGVNTVPSGVQTKKESIDRTG